MEFSNFLAKSSLLATSDVFAGFLLRAKDCYVQYNQWARPQLTFIQPGCELPPFMAVHLSGVHDGVWDHLYWKSDNKYRGKNSVTVANSNCNLNCPYCLNGKRDMNTQFPKPSEILAAVRQYDGIETLDITGGEPTQDLDELKGILLHAGAAFKRIHIYTNGLNLNWDFVQYLGTVQSRVQVIIAISTNPTPGGHTDLEHLRRILAKIGKPPANVFISVNIVDSPGEIEILEVFYALEFMRRTEHEIDTIKVTSPLIHAPDVIKDYQRYLSNLIMLTEHIRDVETPYLKGKSVATLNYERFPIYRGQSDCNARKVSMFGSRIGSCTYNPDQSKTFANTLEAQIYALRSNKCVSCHHNPHGCRTAIGTAECRAFQTKCLTCPSIGACHNRCEAQGTLTEDGCKFLSVVHAFELWLGIKDRTRDEILATWGNPNYLI